MTALPRSSRAETRNPILGLPVAQRLAALDPATRELVADVLVDILGDLAADARKRADQAWRKHKGPMAVYWKAVSVYARHIKLALRWFARPTLADEAAVDGTAAARVEAAHDERSRIAFDAWQCGRQFEETQGKGV